MRTLSLVSLLCLVICGSQAQSADVKQAAPSEQPSSPTPAAAAAPTTPPAAATPLAKPAQSAAVAADDTSNFKVPSSYRARKRDGETVYCRKEALIGTRVAKEYCLSLDQVKEREIHNQETRDRMEQNQRICGGGAGCTSP